MTWEERLKLLPKRFRPEFVATDANAKHSKPAQVLVYHCQANSPSKNGCPPPFYQFRLLPPFKGAEPETKPAK